MAKIQRKKRETVSEAEVQRVLSQGGKSIKANRSAVSDGPKKIQLRLYEDQIEAIDEVRDLRRGSSKVSRHAWILEAIEEKLKREQEEHEIINK